MIRELLDKDYKVIFSNYDAWYLDCGYAGWVTDGNNWCSPYKEWQLQHGNDPYRLLEMRGVNNLEEAKSNVMGGEVAMWTSFLNQRCYEVVDVTMIVDERGVLRSMRSIAKAEARVPTLKAEKVFRASGFARFALDGAIPNVAHTIAGLSHN